MFKKKAKNIQSTTKNCISEHRGENWNLVLVLIDRRKSVLIVAQEKVGLAV